MGSVNKVILIGNLGADPELKYTPSSRALCNLRIATTEVYKDKGGQRQEKTEWHRVTVWGDQAENCSKYLSKGRSVYVEGRLQTRSYDKEGQKHYATDVVADRVVFLGSGGGGASAGEGGARRGGAGPAGGRPGGAGWGEGGGGGAGGGGGPSEEPDSGGPPPSDDDIPF
ncbi:MAG TPA: single-stranded DNA-binding protein [Polyangia bacterium]|jgi:single-strand DNA-binding protein|nr:single-stranded DNA-binding protein [Polyangia bacterium]